MHQTYLIYNKSVVIKRMMSAEGFIFLLTICFDNDKMKEPNNSQFNILPIWDKYVFLSFDKNACSILHTILW